MTGETVTTIGLSPFRDAGTRKAVKEASSAVEAVASPERRRERGRSGRTRQRALSAPAAPLHTPGGTPHNTFPLHQAALAGDARRVLLVLRSNPHLLVQRDVHGNTALHIAVMKGQKDCIRLLLAHNASVKSRNLQGWSPLAEAISYGDRQIVASLVRRYKHQAKDNASKRRPSLLKALQELGNFYLEVQWDFKSWVPLVSRMLPSDTCKIYKHGHNIRLDTTLMDFSDTRWQRGDLTVLFHGGTAHGEAFSVLDNENRVFQRVQYMDPTGDAVEEVDTLMSRDIVSVTLSTKSVHFSRSQTGWLFREGRTENIGGFEAELYTVAGVCLISRKRREHLSEEDVVRNKALLENLRRGGSHRTPQVGSRISLPRPPTSPVSWHDYISAEPGRLLNVLEVVAPFKQFHKLRDFVQLQLPPGFPVKLDVPVFPTVSATVTFNEFRRMSGFPASLFSIPSDFVEDPSHFPDL
uniref:ankyrin repeat domain-containing protein 13C-A-like isoform X2 n=1 Tax=Myxine glutinosa TaxID=7769 RepID=UPI00358FFE98